MPFFYIRADEELAVKVVDLFSMIYNQFLYAKASVAGKVVFDDMHISCESTRCDVTYELLEYRHRNIALIYLPFECYRFRDKISQKLFIDLANRKLEISKEDYPFYGARYEELSHLLNNLLIDPD